MDINIILISLMLVLNLSLAIIFTHDKFNYESLKFAVFLISGSSLITFIAFCMRLSEVDFNSLNIAALIFILINIVVGVFHLAHTGASYKALQINILGNAALSLSSLVLIALAY